MQSPLTHNPPEAQCTGKQAFTSHALATQVARKGSRAKDTPISAYRCPHCGAYHVGSSAIKRTQCGVGNGIKFLEKHA